MLLLKTLLIGLILSIFSNAALSKDNVIQDLMNDHLKKYAEIEHFSGIQVSIQAHGQLTNYVTGFRAIDPTSPEIKTTDLFDIGSITKSFTAALAVIAQTEGKLKLNDTLNRYLPQYSHWGNISLTNLLNMSSGIPNYSDAPTMNYVMSKSLKQFWSASSLINLVYSNQYNPPLKPGYFYSNTGYVLMDMILSKQYKISFKQLLTDKIIEPIALVNTYYPVPDYSKEVLARLVRGYSYNVYDNPELLGQDVTETNLSWAGAAGALVANSEDVVHWVDNLFLGEKFLTNAQKEIMQQVVSVNTGKPINRVNKENPRGFGLGIVQGFRKEIGNYWFYEGETTGYRALYMVVPCNQVIVVVLFNSATNSENDHGGELLEKLYLQTVTQDKSLICQF